MPLNTEWALIMIPLILGFQHGFDLDHLATIDAMTRTVGNNKVFSQMVGFLFSLGHGLVVITISLLIGSGVIQSQVPVWLDSFGGWISIIFLFIFGFLNLLNLLQHSSKSIITLKSYVAKKFINKKFKPLEIILIGVLFAFLSKLIKICNK